jgi:hypothetical protein
VVITAGQLTELGDDVGDRFAVADQAPSVAVYRGVPESFFLVGSSPASSATHQQSIEHRFE